MRLPSRSLGERIPARLLIKINPCRKTREGKTGSATNGHWPRAAMLMNSELESSERSNSCWHHAVENFARRIDGNVTQIDSIYPYIAGTKCFRPVITAAGKRQTQLIHRFEIPINSTSEVGFGQGRVRQSDSRHITMTVHAG